MYEPAGCGKTSIIRLLCDDIVRRDGIVIVITNCRLAENALGGIREIEPRRPILTIIEDIETFMGASDESSSARALLALLDGETQVDHIVHLATTNKPEQLEDRIVKRPGRFDLVVGLHHPVAGARRMYLENLLKDHVTEEEMSEMVEETEGLGLAHLRELVVASYCLGIDRKQTLDRLKSNFKKALRVKGSKESLGFTTNFADHDKDIGLPLERQQSGLWTPGKRWYEK
jgi:SpoVK/Ycf46/Vps4 family AAA+-type ATPase